VPEPVRVVLGEDDVLLREGIIRLLSEAGFDVVAEAGDAPSFLRKALAHRPDVVVVDVQMPPGRGDDGLQAAIELRSRQPAVGVVILSNHYDEEYVRELIADRPDGVGYLLKERVGELKTFIDSVRRVAEGGNAFDAAVVGGMLGRRRTSAPLDRLTPRELAVLAHMAEGMSNQGIAEALVVSQAAVEKHVTSIFQKLELTPTAVGHRRVQAVLAYLNGEMH
jgi:DNA-binding NarL/FixJ family response regulator